MPIKIPDNLPAFSVLNNENIFVMHSGKAEKQDIRPLKIAILNLMPKKIETETQILRLLSNTPIQVDIELLQTASHRSKNTSQEHLIKFYKTFEDVREQRFDGFIITGAPVEQLPYEQVDYWEELCTIMEWSKTNVFSTFHICWGAQAGLYYHFGIPKHELPAKMFGIFPHKVELPNNPLVRGFDETFYVPHSRHTEVRREDIEKIPSLKILTSSRESGVHIITDASERFFFVTGHSEYDRFTLKNEYFRDVDKGLPIAVPAHYFPDNDPSQPPNFTWRAHANLMFSNWINYCVYQRTPYDLGKLEKITV